MRTRRRVVVALFALALVCGALAAVAVAVRSGAGTFDRRVWRRPVPYCTKSARGRMVDALVGDRLKRGMPMPRVRALLGPPDTRYADEWLYYVTREPSLTHEGCLSLSLRTNGRTLIDASLDSDSG